MKYATHLPPPLLQFRLSHAIPVPRNWREHI